MVGKAARVLAVLSLTGCAAVPTPAPGVVPPPIISGFGDWRGSGGAARAWQHHGIDIRTRIGTEVLAAADGVVLRVDEGRNSGKLVLVRHAEDLSTEYLHLSEVSVRPGQAVRRGEPIGRSGMTGNATTPHLHFGVCRLPGGRCGSRIHAGWDDPTGYWVEGNPCFDARRDYGDARLRLTYPLPCGASDA